LLELPFWRMLGCWGASLVVQGQVFGTGFDLASARSTVGSSRSPVDRH